MTRRTRSMLVDASIGKIFTNTNQITPTDPSKLIAGTRLLSASIANRVITAARITNNLGGKMEGLRFISGAVITSTTVSLTTAASGQPLKFDIRVGTSYDTSTIILSDELLPNVKQKLLTTVITVPSNNSIYVDITQIGSVGPGRGFGLQFTYFAGLQ